MAKKKKRAQQKCRTCGKPGHNAKSCAEKAAVSPVRRRAAAHRKDGTPRGSIAGAADGSAQDFSTTARESAKATVRRKLEEELAWARDYTAELERLVAGA